MALPIARRVGDSYQQSKITAAAALTAGDLTLDDAGVAGVVLGTEDKAIDDPAILAIDGLWEIDCATGTTAGAGAQAFFNTSTGLVVTALAASCIYIGNFAKAKTSGQLKATIRLVGRVADWFPWGTAQSLSGAGAIDVLSYVTKWTTGGAQAGTLANGVQAGQRKRIQMIVDGGDGTLTPVSLSGGTTITFADAGDFVELVWNGAAWVVLFAGNDADGATAPVIA